MTIWGMIIGGATGFALGGPIGALLGAAAGHLAEKSMRGPQNNEQARQVAFTVAVIALSAKMARADGQVSRSEIEAFRQRVHIPQEEVARVGKFWDLARQTPEGFEAYASQTANLFGPRNPILEQLLELLFFIARADGEIKGSEWAYLAEVSRLFGYDEQDFRHFSDMWGQTETRPHSLLGVAEDAGLEEIRTAWKRLVKEYHPDRLRAEGLPDEFVEAANDKLAAINTAYKVMRAAAERRAAGQPQQS